MSESFDIENDIRAATPEDFQELYRVACMLHADNGQHEFSEWKARHYIWRGCNRDNSIVWVIGPSDNIKACLYLEVQPVFYSDECQLSETFLFVREDHRKGDFAKRLIRHAKHCADESGVDLIIGVISDKRLSAKRRLYERDLPIGGVFYIYNKERGEKHQEERRVEESERSARKAALAESLYRLNTRGPWREWKELDDVTKNKHFTTINTVLADKYAKMSIGED